MEKSANHPGIKNIKPLSEKVTEQPQKRKKLDVEMQKNDKKNEKKYDPTQEDDSIKWKSLQHHGVVFPPRYERKNLKIKINGLEKELNNDQEEALLWWAKILDSDFAKKPKVQENYFKELIQLFGDKDKCEFKSLSELDFSNFTEYIKQEDEKKKEKSTDQKKAERDKKQEIEYNYGYAIVDGRYEKISNYSIEPPGIFRGRGEHPLAGTFKKRLLPEDVTINIGHSDYIPKCPLPGHAWKSVVSDNTTTFLSSYKSGTNHSKYVFLDASSLFKGVSDKKKYEKARKLKNIIEKIRENYLMLMDDKDEAKRQLGTATYLIDKLALRVGNEKDEDEADTVGCTSLRVEHIKFEENNKITLDFLGKDSMRYFNTVEVIEKCYRNLKLFVIGKKDSDNLFCKINSGKLNEYLKNFMPELSAKVFRTYNASSTLQKVLQKFEDNNNIIDEKVKFYNDANREVAILCNHQKTVSKNFDTQMELQMKTLGDMKDEFESLEKLISKMRGKSKKKNLKEGGNNIEKLEGKRDKLKSKIANFELKMKDKEENKEIALGTSKINYNDPRITVSWCKKYDVPIEKLFSSKLRSKFGWAMYTDTKWAF